MEKEKGRYSISQSAAGGSFSGFSQPKTCFLGNQLLNPATDPAQFNKKELGTAGMLLCGLWAVSILSKSLPMKLNMGSFGTS